jgi:hypothetical protein
MPFLEVLTRTYRRPKMQAICEQSMREQCDMDYTQTLLNDPEGRGIAWSYENMARYAPFLAGDYIWILDDDDMVTSKTFIADLKGIVAECDPDVIMVKMDHAQRGILPNKCWQQKPEMGGIGVSAFVVRRAIWQRHSKYLSAHYAGDFDFIASIFERDYEIYWFDCIASRVQKISLGAAE